MGTRKSQAPSAIVSRSRNRSSKAPQCLDYARPERSSPARQPVEVRQSVWAIRQRGSNCGRTITDANELRLALQWLSQPPKIADVVAPLV